MLLWFLRLHTFIESEADGSEGMTSKKISSEYLCVNM